MCGHRYAACICRFSLAMLGTGPIRLCTAMMQFDTDRYPPSALHKSPYAIAMKDGSPFGIAGIWENWKDLSSGEWLRTFAIITTEANALVDEIHDRMPAILARSDYVRWLGDEPDPHDLLRPYPSEEMRIWPISTRVNKPKNDDSSILKPIKIELAV